MLKTTFPKPNPLFIRVASAVLGLLFWLYFRLSFERDPAGLAQLAVQPRPVIVVFNHTSHLDVPAVALCLGPRFMCRVTLPGKKELFDAWQTRWIMRLAGVVPLDREVGDMSAARSLLRAINAGQHLVMAPEGTRSTDGALQPFKLGFLKLAERANALILPIAVRGAAEAMPRGEHWPRRRKVTVHVGTLIDPCRELPHQPTHEDYTALADTIRAQIAAGLAG